ncbi:hypothetical protein BD626DRAFT_570426 [Schizophyllum amplum]|uniref:Aspartic peptidase domain-containing protein n=1 Tax=Schizophyllum amplum TaxID=97359 RepID=A0A550CA87_9AGAR|nr:hypothetical protein BD626DRAFT_570426 [Auriculariopsis ampla]
MQSATNSEPVGEIIWLSIELSDYSEEQYLKSLNYGLARIATRHNVPAPTVSWPFVATTVTATPIATAATPPSQDLRKGRSLTTSPAGGGRPVHAAFTTPTFVSPVQVEPSGAVSRRQDRKIHMSALPRDDRVGVERMATLMISLATGEWDEEGVEDWLDIVADSCSSSVWTFAHDFQVLRGGLKADDPRLEKGDCNIDEWQQSQNPTAETWFASEYVDGSVYNYLPVAAKVTILRRFGTGVGTRLVIPNYKYRLAKEVGWQLNGQSNVDGIMGFMPQIFHDHSREKEANISSAAQTLPNQMRAARILPKTLPKITVITPSHNQSIGPKMWIGGTSWPTEKQRREQGYAFNQQSEICLRLFPCQPSRTSISNWVVNLTEIAVVDVAVQVLEVLFSGNQRTYIDTGAELTYLPNSVFDKVCVGNSTTHVSKISKTRVEDDDKYVVDLSKIDAKHWLRLGFESKEGGQCYITLAPLRSALTFRNTVDASGRSHHLSIARLESLSKLDGVAVIGMSWLQYLWQMYQDGLPVVDATEIRLVSPGLI